MIRVFVGCPGNNEDLECQAVLEYTLRHYATEPVTIEWMRLTRNPKSFWYSDGDKGWQTKSWATPFTALRWAIPAFCKFEGRAIYIDSDVIIRDDIKQLHDQAMPDNAVMLAKDETHFSVLVFDCARARPLLPPVDAFRADPLLHKQVRNILKEHIAHFQGDWNSLDGDGYRSANDPAIKLLHYTTIPTQPNHKHARARLEREGQKHWFSGPDEKHALPGLQDLFDRLLKEAIEQGFTPARYRLKTPFGNYGRGKADRHLGAA